MRTGPPAKAYESGTKWCNQCKRNLPLDAFRMMTRKNGEIYPFSECLQCSKARQKKYYWDKKNGTFIPVRREDDPRAHQYEGRRFGKLLVIELDHKEKFLNKKGNTKTRKWWKCLCDCGEYLLVQTQSLSRRTTTHCGCSPALAKEDGALNRRWVQYRNGSRVRSLSFLLSKEEFSSLVTGNCFYCGKPPSALEAYSSIPGFFNGIDRVDSSLGYFKENCVPCCRTCNIAKSDMSKLDFLSWAKRLYENLNLGETENVSVTS